MRIRITRLISVFMWCVVYSHYFKSIRVIRDYSLSLFLFMLRVLFADDIKPSLAADGLALTANFFHRRSYLHCYSLLTIRPRLSLGLVISRITRSPGMTRIRWSFSFPARCPRISFFSSPSLPTFTRKRRPGKASTTFPSTLTSCGSVFINRQVL